MNGVIYARYSSDRQTEQSIEERKQEIIKFVKQKTNGSD